MVDLGVGWAQDVSAGGRVAGARYVNSPDQRAVVWEQALNGTCTKETSEDCSYLGAMNPALFCDFGPNGFTPDASGAWKVTGYSMVVARIGAGLDPTTTTAATTTTKKGSK